MPNIVLASLIVSIIIESRDLKIVSYLMAHNGVFIVVSSCSAMVVLRFVAVRPDFASIMFLHIKDLLL